jgi:alpha-glucosidase
MSVNLSLSGQPFNGPDIGGFVDSASPQLWAHWISLGAFYPFSRAHSTKGSDNQEPWSFGPETENAARIALQRRYRLMPYLYTAFRQAHINGMPVMQPVFFADPDDHQLRMEDQAFLLGRDILVIPKWAGSVQMPKGIWQRVSLVGENTQSDPYQCDLQLRGGSIVPLGPVVQTTEQITLQSPLTLIVVLDEHGQAEGTLYEDAGDGYDYLKNGFRFSQFTAVKRDTAVVVECTEQVGALAEQKRLVTVVLVDGEGIRHGFGDICRGVTVQLSEEPKKVTEMAF